MKTTDKIEVMLAFTRGEPIQIHRSDGTWKDWGQPEVHPEWDWCHFSYRIKPKPREWWVHLSPNTDVEYCMHSSLASAAECERKWGVLPKCVHVREVLEEE